MQICYRLSGKFLLSHTGKTNQRYPYSSVYLPFLFNRVLFNGSAQYFTISEILGYPHDVPLKCNSRVLLPHMYLYSHNECSFTFRYFLLSIWRRKCPSLWNLYAKKWINVVEGEHQPKHYKDCIAQSAKPLPIYTVKVPQSGTAHFPRAFSTEKLRQQTLPLSTVASLLVAISSMQNYEAIVGEFPNILCPHPKLQQVFFCYSMFSLHPWYCTCHLPHVCRT